MTRMKQKPRPVWHETGCVYDGRAILAAESPVNLLLRLKGTRCVMKLPWAVALIRAAELAVAEKRLSQGKKPRRVRIRRGALR